MVAIVENRSDRAAGRVDLCRLDRFFLDLDAEIPTIEQLGEEIFPGVPRLGIRVGIEPGRELHCNPDLLRAAYCIAHALDSPFYGDGGRTLIEQYIPDIYSQTLFSAQEVVSQHRALINALCGLEDSADEIETVDIAYAFPIYGSVTFAEQLRMRDPYLNLQFLDIRGTAGTMTGFAELQDAIPEDLLDPYKLIVYVDDVGDSMITAAVFAMQRRIRRLGISEDEVGEDEYQAMIERIQSLRAEKYTLLGKRKGADELEAVSITDQISQIDQRLAVLYPGLAKLFLDENVVLATLYSKNSYVYDRLGELSGDEAASATAAWAEVQRRVLSVSIPIDPNHWITGGQSSGERHPVLDTDISGSEISSCMAQSGSGVLPFLSGMGVGDISMRLLAGNRALKVFNPGVRDDLIAVVARLLEKYLLVCHSNLFSQLGTPYLNFLGRQGPLHETSWS